MDAETKLGEWKPVLWNENTNDFATPHGTMGSRWDNEKKWNLRLEDEETGEKIDPRLSLLGMEESIGTVQIPYFSDDGNKVLERTIPVKRL